jgi:hypothetical protein
MPLVAIQPPRSVVGVLSDARRNLQVFHLKPFAAVWLLGSSVTRRFAVAGFGNNMDFSEALVRFAHD